MVTPNATPLNISDNTVSNILFVIVSTIFALVISMHPQNFGY